MAEKRIGYYDIAKGIGIFCVVYAHAKAPFSKYMYLFHMPLFFLISGLLYNASTPPGTYVKRKIQTLYIPFVFWNALFCTGMNIYKHIYIYIYDGIAKTARQLFLVALTLSKSGEFLGATWFLGALLLISVLYKLLDYSLPESKTKDFFLLFFFAALATMAFEVNLKYLLSRTFVLSFFFAVGVFCRKHGIDKTLLCGEYAIAAVASVLAFLLFARYNWANMGKDEYGHTLTFFLGAFLASYGVIYFSKVLDGREEKPAVMLKSLLSYLGRNSMDIVIWQFVAFRIVIILQMYLYHEEITVSNVLSYYPIHTASGGLWWVAYTLVGLFVPILWGKFLRFGPWGKLLKRLHIV